MEITVWPLELWKWHSLLPQTLYTTIFHKWVISKQLFGRFNNDRYSACLAIMLGSQITNKTIPNAILGNFMNFWRIFFFRKKCFYFHEYVHFQEWVGRFFFGTFLSLSVAYQLIFKFNPRPTYLTSKLDSFTFTPAIQNCPTFTFTPPYPTTNLWVM